MKTDTGFLGDMMELHSNLSRRQVWCTRCGYTKMVGGNPFREGWPKCCGYTMTIDSPEERAVLSVTPSAEPMPGWLLNQVRLAEEDIKEWPKWIKDQTQIAGNGD